MQLATRTGRNIFNDAGATKLVSLTGLNTANQEFKFLQTITSITFKQKSMRNDLAVSSSIDINAQPAKVWQALTTPEIIKEYLYGTETVTDWKVGSEIIFQGDYQGHKYRDKGVIQSSIPNELFSYTYWSGFSGLEDKPENYSLVTYRLKQVDNNQTRFTWEQKGFANEEGYKHSVNGMPEFLQKIKEIVER